MLLVHHYLQWSTKYKFTVDSFLHYFTFFDPIFRSLNSKYSLYFGTRGIFKFRYLWMRGSKKSPTCIVPYKFELVERKPFWIQIKFLINNLHTYFVHENSKYWFVFFRPVCCCFPQNLYAYFFVECNHVSHKSHNICYITTLANANVLYKSKHHCKH